MYNFCLNKFVLNMIIKTHNKLVLNMYKLFSKLKIKQFQKVISTTPFLQIYII